MKLSIYTLSFIATLALASPTTSPSLDDAVSALVPRALPKENESCKVNIKFATDQKGTCLNSNKGNTCSEGLFVRGYCGGGNSVMCCIPNRWFTKQ
jgi:hypothetical protein